MCTLDTQFAVDPNYALFLPPGFFLDTLSCPLVSPYDITFEMCTLDTQSAVDTIYTLLLPGLFYGITLQMCTLDTKTVVDPRYTLLPPGLPPGFSLWNYLGDVYPGYTFCCRS